MVKERTKKAKKMKKEREEESSEDDDWVEFKAEIKREKKSRK